LKDKEEEHSIMMKLAKDLHNNLLQKTKDEHREEVEKLRTGMREAEAAAGKEKQRLTSAARSAQDLQE